VRLASRRACGRQARAALAATEKARAGGGGGLLSARPDAGARAGEVHARELERLEDGQGPSHAWSLDVEDVAPFKRRLDRREIHERRVSGDAPSPDGPRRILENGAGEPLGEGPRETLVAASLEVEDGDPTLASERVARFHLPGRVHIDLEFTAMRARARHTRIVATGSPPAANDTTYRKRARATPVRSRKLTLVWRMARSTSAASRAPRS
jgi:hypothetical protein